jgi:hypothetical protein
MAKVEIEGSNLVVQLEGWDALWALKRRIEIPLSQVRDVHYDSASPRRRPRGLRVPGTYLPGVIVAGTYRGMKSREFWSVRRPEKAIQIDLEGGKYDHLFLQVENPEAVVAEIKSHLPAR